MPPSALNFGELRFEQLDFRILATIHTGDGAAIGLHAAGENHYNWSRETRKVFARLSKRACDGQAGVVRHCPFC